MANPDRAAVEAAIVVWPLERVDRWLEYLSSNRVLGETALPDNEMQALLVIARAYLDAQKAKPVPDYADLFSVKGFQEAVARGEFVDDDGHGYFVTATMRRGPMYPSTPIAEYPPGTTHIAWFNK